MINAVLMIGSMIATVVIITLGLAFTFSPLGSAWTGLTLVFMGAALATTCIPTSLAELRRLRHRRRLREQAARSLARLNARRRQTATNAPGPKLHLVKAAEEKPALTRKHEPPTAA